jgi:hypothetical protein
VQRAATIGEAGTIIIPTGEITLQRYKTENNEVIVEVTVNNTRQLFNDRDPTPFKERELDQNFVTFLLNSVQEFPYKAKTRLRIIINKEPDSAAEKVHIQEAIHSFFKYEAGLVHSRKKKSMREGRLFMVVGLFTLFSCLSFSQLLESSFSQSKIMLIIQEGLVIIGWVAMWRPLEMFLYDWWPLREQQLYMNKIANMEKDIIYSQ